MVCKTGAGSVKKNVVGMKSFTPFNYSRYSFILFKVNYSCKFKLLTELSFNGAYCMTFYN